MTSKIPAKITCNLDISMIIHTKNWSNSTFLSQANKIMKSAEIQTSQHMVAK
jgi:hypothetical protein